MRINTKIALSAAMILTAAATSTALANDLGPVHKKPLGWNSYGSVVGGAAYPGSTSRREASSCPALEGYPDCHP